MFFANLFHIEVDLLGGDVYCWGDKLACDVCSHDALSHILTPDNSMAYQFLCNHLQFINTHLTYIHTKEIIFIFSIYEWMWIIFESIIFKKPARPCQKCTQTSPSLWYLRASTLTADRLMAMQCSIPRGMKQGKPIFTSHLLSSLIYH